MPEPAIDIYEELLGVLRALGEHAVPYCLVGGWAVSFHAEPRATNDIDLLTLPESADAAAAAVCTCGFFESAEPWTFSSGVTLRRFMKCAGPAVLLVDLLFSHDPPHRGAVADAEERERDGVRFRLIAKPDLVRMKRTAGRTRDLLDLDALGEAVERPAEESA